MIKLILRFILRFIRIRFVHDRVLKKDYKFDPKKQRYVIPEGANVYNRKGGALALYAGRFVLISANDFTQLLMGNVCDETQLLEKYPGLKHKDNIDEYIEEYNRIVDDFYKSYTENSQNNNRVIRTINEEFSHHKLIRETPTYVILNSLTIYYRICSCYLTYYRYHKMEIDKKVSEALLNTYLIRSYIINITYPIVEASYHYHDDLSQIETIYGTEIKKWSERFLIIENTLNNKNVGKQSLDNLLLLVQYVFLSFPYISTIINYTKINLLEFIQFYHEWYIEKNEILYKNLIDKINSTTFREKELEDFLITERENRTSNTQLDREFKASLLFLATETTKDFIPSSLLIFIFKRFVCSKNRGVLLTILKNQNDVNDAYNNFPPVKCVGLKNHSLCIDGSMKIFEGKSFIIAQNSFEPTLAGENGYINLADSQICKTLLIQALLIKSLSLLLLNLENEQFKKSAFKNEFGQILSNMPNENREWIKNEILDLFYEESKEIFKGFNSIQDVKMEIVASRFEESINRLQGLIAFHDDEEKKSFYTFCDVNYVHGF